MPAGGALPQNSWGPVVGRCQRIFSPLPTTFCDVKELRIQDMLASRGTSGTPEAGVPAVELFTCEAFVVRKRLAGPVAR